MSDVIPKVGEWALFRVSPYDQVGVELKQIAKVTAAQLKFVGSNYPRQCSILSVVASFADEETAKNVRDAIGGIAGEFSRRRRAAEDERSVRITSALIAANEQVRRAIAKATSA